MELRGTPKFCSALRYVAIDRRFLTVDNVRAILVSEEPYNPMETWAGPGSGEDRHSFKQAFDCALQA